MFILNKLSSLTRSKTVKELFKFALIVIIAILGVVAVSAYTSVGEKEAEAHGSWWTNANNCNSRIHYITDTQTCANKNGVFIGPKPTLNIKSNVTTSSQLKTQKGWDDLTNVEKIKRNPNKCNQKTQWIWASDGTCHDKPLAKKVRKVSTTPAQTIQTPKPVATPAPIAPQTVTAPTGNLCSLVNNYSNWNRSVAYGVCMAESGGNANAYNPEAHNGCNGSLGLFQIACVHGAGSSFDPYVNIEYANKLYTQQGFQPWGAYTNGSYLRF